MLNLTAAIAIPNIAKMRVDAVQFDGTLNVATVTATVFGVGAPGKVYQVVTLTVRDGTSTGVRANASSVGFTDMLEIFSAATPTGFTDLLASNTGNLTVRNKAAESALLAAGLLPAGTVS